MSNIGDYESTYAEFDWETPERFNFGRDVVDRLAEGERPAMIWLGTDGTEKRLDFAYFSRLSNRFANAARELGINRGDRVMVLMGKVPEWHAVLIGLLKLGAIAIPCAPQLRANDLKFRAEHSGAVALISDQDGIEQAEAMRNDVPNLRKFISLGDTRESWSSFEELVDGAQEDFTAEDTAADEGAFILYTSGTTRHPKGVLHTHGYTHAKRVQARYWLDLQEGDRLWCTSGTGWAKSVWNVLLGPWSWGVEIFFHEGAFDPAERLDLISRYGITVLCQAPTEYRFLANTPDLADADLSSIRHAVSAGEPLNAPVIERWKELHGLTIYDGYGQTENTLLIGNYPGMDVKVGAMGKPSPGCDIRIIDHEGNECQPDEPGRHRARRTHSRALQGVLGATGGIGGSLSARLLPDRRPGDAGRGRIFVVRGPGGRCDPLRRLPHRSVRGRGGPHKPSGGSRERRRSLPGRGPRQRRQGVYSPRGRLRAGRRARQRVTGSLQERDRPVQISAPDRVHRRVTKDHQR